MFRLLIQNCWMNSPPKYIYLEPTMLLNSCGTAVTPSNPRSKRDHNGYDSGDPDRNNSGT